MVEILDSLAIWSLMLYYVLGVGWIAAINYVCWRRMVARISYSSLHFFLRDYEMAAAHGMRGRVSQGMRCHVGTS
jgi:hypothetical protein